MIHVVFFVLLSFLVNFDLNAPPSNPNKVVKPDGRTERQMRSPLDDEPRDLPGRKKAYSNISSRISSRGSSMNSAGSTNSSIGNSSQGSVQFDAPWESTSRSPRSQREAWEGSSPDKAWPLPRRSRSGSIYEGKTDDAWDLPEKSTPRLGGRPRPSREIDEGSGPDEPWALSRRNSLLGFPSEASSSDDESSRSKSGWLSNVKNRMLGPKSSKDQRYFPSDGKAGDQGLQPMQRRMSFSDLSVEVNSKDGGLSRQRVPQKGNVAQNPNYGYRPSTLPDPMDPDKAIKLNR